MEKDPLTAAYDRYVEKWAEQQQRKRLSFPVDVQLTVDDVETILCYGVPDDLADKLRTALDRAERSYGMRNVDFGDLKED